MEPAQSTTYPNLAVMALDILSILAMSAEPERLFLSKQRPSVEGGTIS